MSSVLGILVAAIAVYLAYKVISALLKGALLLVAVIGVYWFAAPLMGWPAPSELFYVLGPDFGGKRIEEVMHPGELARRAKEQVMEGLLEQGDLSSQLQGILSSPPTEAPAEAQQTPMAVPASDPQVPPDTPLPSGPGRE